MSLAAIVQCGESARFIKFLSTLSGIGTRDLHVRNNLALEFEQALLTMAIRHIPRNF
jgi:hypothetical protein